MIHDLRFIDHALFHRFTAISESENELVFRETALITATDITGYFPVSANLAKAELGHQKPAEVLRGDISDFTIAQAKFGLQHPVFAFD